MISTPEKGRARKTDKVERKVKEHCMSNNKLGQFYRRL